MSGNIKSSYFTGSEGSPIYSLGKNEFRGQIEKVHFIDDESNISKKWVEYNVTIEQASGAVNTITNVPYCPDLSGSNDKACVILEPNDAAFDGAKLSTKTSFSKKNGTIVVVSFFDSNFQKPYISGLATNERNDGATKDKGIHKSSVFRGFEDGIDKDGVRKLKYTGPNTPDGKKIGNPTNSEVIIEEKITLKSGDVTVVIDKGAVTITSGSSVVTIKDGKIDLKGDLVDIGAADLTAVLFEHLKQEFNMHQHPAGTLGAPTGPPQAPMLSVVGSKSVKLKV